MKFVSKLSVISLIVLMFSFMNLATAAPSCPGQPPSPSSVCNTYTKSLCGVNFTKDKNSSTGYSQCKWVNSKCNSGGTPCNYTPPDDDDDNMLPFNSKKPK
jgi:hypothetical protein